MLYLNQQTIESSITMEEMIDAMEEAYLIYADKNYQMPTRMQVQQDTNTMILMPVYYGPSNRNEIAHIFSGK